MLKFDTSLPWKITPVSLPGVAFFEALEGSRVPILNPLVITLSLSVVLGMLFALEGMYGYAALCGLAVLVIFAIPQVAAHVRRKNTYYEIYPDRIVFYLFEKYVREVKELPMKAVRMFKYEAYANDIGHIHVITKGEPPFRTRSFAGKPRFYPVLESIENCVLLSERLNAHIESD